MIANPVAAQTPEAVAERYLRHVMGGDERGAAGLVHPDGQEAVGAALVRLAARPVPPDLRVLADDWPDLAELSAEAAYGRFVASLDAGLPSRAEVAVLGTVAEGDTLHVLLRVPEAGWMRADQYPVVSVRPDGAGWGVVPLRMGWIVALADADGNRNALHPEPMRVEPAPDFVDVTGDCTPPPGASGPVEPVYYLNGERLGRGFDPEELDPAAVSGLDVYRCDEQTDQPSDLGIIVITTD